MNANTAIRTLVRGTLLAACIPALALPALGAVSANTQGAGGITTKVTRAATEALPPTLRSAFYRTLSKDTGPAYTVQSNGCATLANQALKACFDSGGAHFTGAGSPLVLRLAAWGRGEGLSPVEAVKPTIRGNRVSYAHGNLSEWWQVLPMGFEQGFTLAKRPGGQGELTLALAVNLQVKEQNDTLVWGKLRYGKLVVTDAKGKIVPATLTSENDHILIAVNDAHAVYPLTVDPLVWIEQKVTASDGAANDYFGTSVAVSGSTALVGAYRATIAGNAGQGAVYVFHKANGVWSETQKLTASDGAAYNHFGGSVALDGAVALIGATGAGSNYQGAAYVFTSTNGTWSETQEITASGSNYFGYSVALDGSTALIGAPDTTIGGNALQGAAYVFAYTDGVWSQIAELDASDGAASDQFGHSVALEGTTAVVSAIEYSPFDSGPGAAYVFAESDGVWSENQKLTANDGEAADRFGNSVAITGTTILIGAPHEDIHSSPREGAVYVFTKFGDAWTQAQKLLASDGSNSNWFGAAVAVSGTTALIGAYGPPLNGGQGAAYVFTDSGGAWVQTQKLVASDGEQGDFFGSALATDGTTSLVGANDAAVNGNGSQGAAYFYGRSDLGLAVSAPEAIGHGQQYVSQTIATNNASAASPAVAVTVAVPAAASFVSANATQGSCSEDSGVVTCDFGQINGNAGMATASVTLKATGAPGTTIENTASVAKATPTLTASAATEITSPGSCPAGYTEFSGHLDADGTFTSSPIEVTEAGQKYVDLTAPASFAFFVIVNTRYGEHTYVYPHAKHGHRWGAAGSYQVGVQAGATGGDYTLCVQLNPSQ